MAIIGVSGKIGSGKDTIGKIIQILTLFPNMSTERIIQHLNKELSNNAFEIQKFAGALKDIVCLLTNCTRSQLEDEAFKNFPLGKEWEVYRLEVPNAFNERTKILDILFNSEKDAWEYNDRLGYVKTVCKVHKEVLTRRKLLQLIGTECGRNILHPNIWVNALMSKYEHTHYIYGDTKYILQDDGSYNPIDLNHSGMSEQDMINLKAIKKECNWIITDVRFPNEVRAIKDKGGFVIRVTRYPKTITRSRSIKEQEEIPFDINNPTHKELYEGECLNQHPSETALDMYPFDIRIANDETIEELINKVRDLLKTKNII